MLIDVAENGLKAVDLFSESKPGFYDAILMDIRMPVMDDRSLTPRYVRWNARMRKKYLLLQ